MAVCVSACMPVSALGAEIAGPVISGTAQENNDNKEETVSEEAVEKKDSGKIEDEITEVQDTVTVAADTDVLDYPGRKEKGADVTLYECADFRPELVGEYDAIAFGCPAMGDEVLEEDEISRTGTIDDIWSRILFEDDNGEEQVGYIPTSVLEGYEDKNQVASDATSDGTVEAGIIHKSTGEGVFAKAVEGVTQTGGNAGVLEGQPIMVSADSSLRPLGVFHITHYCQCSICCGPWANGITSTGVTATTNRTIAVDPTVIPYGSKVVINGQVYVAEDCGGAIKNNRIDIYMGSHAEALNSGVFDVEVYLLEEGSSVQGIEGIQEGNQE